MYVFLSSSRPRFARCASAVALVTALVLTVGLGSGSAQKSDPTSGSSSSVAELAEFWQAPAALARLDLFHGPWGAEHQPNASGLYDFVSMKTSGVSPGYKVKDQQGREWSVKQGSEAKVEVVTSRILSAVGYHQPPVYYLPAWRLRYGPTPGPQEEGRFRLKVPGIKDKGEWSWTGNPFVGTRPYRGLIVLMMILNESDLKDSNNSLYEIGAPADGVHRWYVVRDLGTALGETGRINPLRGDARSFEKHRFIKAVTDGYVEFHFGGLHKEILKHRVTPADVRWMCGLLSQLSQDQWQAAFRAAGYERELSDRFIRRIQEKIEQGRAIPDVIVGTYEVAER